MDIILDTLFPTTLPRIAEQGFRDSFDRPDGSELGYVSNGRPWVAAAPTSGTSAPGTYRILGGELAVATPGGGIDNYIGADPLTPRQRVEAVMGKVDTGAGGIFLAGRLTTTNFSGFRLARINSTDRHYRLSVVRAAAVVATFSDATHPVMADGDRIRAEYDPTARTLRVWVNDALLFDLGPTQLPTNFVDQHGQIVGAYNSPANAPAMTWRSFKVEALP